jgi:hypothetical protein
MRRRIDGISGWGHDLDIIADPRSNEVISKKVVFLKVALGLPIARERDCVIRRAVSERTADELAERREQMENNLGRL